MYPEVGFTLPRTLKLIREELDKMGVPYTEKYGKSSIVATINEEKSHYTIAIRADTDALPIQEENDVEYRSRIDGQMHACGHDVHTAILLGTIKELNEIRDKINCRVKFIFQSAEEYETPGGMLMAQDGVMEEIDVIVSCHVDPFFDVGTVIIDPGRRGANSHGFTVELYGKSAHAAYQNNGIDAIAMGVKVYTALQFMIAKEIDPLEPCVLNIGAFNAGETNNVIADYCRLYGTLRTHSNEVSNYVLKRINEIAEAVASEMGGRCKVEQTKFLPSLYNDEEVTEKMRKAAVKVVGEENIRSKKPTMGGEDFSYFLNEKPGMMFRLGIRNESKGITSTGHTSIFDVDEGCIDIGIKVFKQFVLDNM